MPNLPFTIDAKLLRELGERLVGKPSIALGELIKNSYDADAETVDIQLNQSGDGFIVVLDNGHGMTFDEFKSYWMRIGSVHKEKWHYSPKYRRVLTGQKGIGRLAVQFLGNEMELKTVSASNLNERLTAFICWEDAINTGELVKATVEYEIKRGDYKPGTEIKLTSLRHEEWTENDFKELARDIWMLAPPFRAFKTKQGSFEVDLRTPDESIRETFTSQMSAFLNAYEGKINGKNVDGHVNASLIHEKWGQVDYEYEISEIKGVHMPDGKKLNNGEFEIRIYRLVGRQPFGILVDDLRDYMSDFHGVHIYDSGFHLPYYGQKEGDWLGISYDQARRIAVSNILPDEYQVPSGLTRLPGLRRTLGVVKINTSEEPGLEIAISRDRLVDTKTFRALREMVRYALHLYAMEDQRFNLRKRKIILRKLPSGKMETVDQVLKKYREEIPESVYEDLKSEVDRAIEDTEERKSIYEDKISFLGVFATAGISSLAYHHEIQKQLGTIDDVSEEIKEMIAQKKLDEDKLAAISSELKEWVERAKQLEALFSYYGDADIITDRECYEAGGVLEKIKGQLSGLLRGVEIKNDVPKDVMFPEASLVELGAIFQNVILNAYNAVSLAENPKKRVIQLLYVEENNEKAILVQDTGIGIDLENSEELFEPFKRKLELSPEKKALGYGGGGIGLTIVRIISERIGCRAVFTNPIGDFKTAFKLYWREEP